MKRLNRYIPHVALIPHNNPTLLHDIHLSTLFGFLLSSYLLWRGKLLVKISTSEDFTIQTLGKMLLNISSTEERNSEKHRSNKTIPANPDLLFAIF